MHPSVSVTILTPLLLNAGESGHFTTWSAEFMIHSGCVVECFLKQSGSPASNQLCFDQVTSGTSKDNPLLHGCNWLWQVCIFGLAECLLQLCGRYFRKLFLLFFFFSGRLHCLSDVCQPADLWHTGQWRDAHLLIYLKLHWKYNDFNTLPWWACFSFFEIIWNLIFYLFLEA